MRAKRCWEEKEIGVWRLNMLKNQQMVLVRNGRGAIDFSTAIIHRAQYCNFVESVTTGGKSCNFRTSRRVCSWGGSVGSNFSVKRLGSNISCKMFVPSLNWCIVTDRSSIFRNNVLSSVSRILQWFFGGRVCQCLRWGKFAGYLMGQELFNVVWQFIKMVCCTENEPVMSM